MTTVATNNSAATARPERVPPQDLDAEMAEVLTGREEHLALRFE